MTRLIAKEKICCAMSVMRIHIITYSIIAYMLSLSKLKDTLSDSSITAGSVFTIASSFAQLMHQTCQVYPVNGKWIMANFCVIGVIVFIMIESLGLCSPGTHMMAKFFVLHGTMLTARLMFDTNKACGMDLQ